MGVGCVARYVRRGIKSTYTGGGGSDGVCGVRFAFESCGGVGRGGRVCFNEWSHYKMFRFREDLADVLLITVLCKV